jgi:AAHS family 4-hydroxybenzoate transporter-like MFS transporter
VNSEKRGLTVNEIIDERPVSPYQRMTIVLCGIVLLLDGFDTQSMGFLAPPISEDLGIPMASFGSVFAAGLFGLMIGAISIGPIADRWGRKGAIILSALIFGLFTVFTARATTLNELVLFRFLTGLGLGGAMPNVVALASEFAPSRLQSTLVTIIFAGMGGGALLAGMAGSVMIPIWGWRSVLYLGGVLPIVLVAVLIPLLPESVRFLSLRGSNSKRVSEILSRISPELATVSIKPPAASPQLEGIPVKHLFTEGRTVGTLLLWIPFFMNLLLLYFILSWLPALLRQAGMNVQAGIAAVSAFSLGGVIGSIIQGRMMSKWGSQGVLLAEFGACVVLVGLLAYTFSMFAVMLSITFLLGILVQGAQAGLNALAAMFYPTLIRSTGVGWALGMGRIGSIVGPYIGGMLVALQWGPQEIFTAGIVPAIIAAAAVVLSTSMRSTASAYRVQISREPVSAAH